ncbi:MAG TPA: hypothetical protein PKJ83_08510 [Cyclobacteriaceae bacterium]|nr:hypothetical protein [Cyclobacteriaceae bacterium]HPW63839.1 hypothetical protein [Cyclobacteriaceae bacterium]
MKKLIYFCGVISCVAVISGSLLKILHMDGGSLLLTVGLALFFFYLAAKSYLKHRA